MRNSWGTYWGENGYARVMMHKDNLALERDCTWGVPSMKKPTLETPRSKVMKGTYHDYNNPCVKRCGVSYTGTFVCTCNSYMYMYI